MAHSLYNFLLRWSTKRQTQAYQLWHTEAQYIGSQGSYALLLFHSEQDKYKQRGDSATREINASSPSPVLAKEEAHVTLFFSKEANIVHFWHLHLVAPPSVGQAVDTLALLTI